MLQRGQQGEQAYGPRSADKNTRVDVFVGIDISLKPLTSLHVGINFAPYGWCTPHLQTKYAV